MDLDATIAKLDQEIAERQEKVRKLREAKAIIDSEGGKTPSKPPLGLRPNLILTSPAHRNGASARVDEIKGVIGTFTHPFQSSEITYKLREKFPNDQKLSKKVARVLYDLRTDGLLGSEEITQSGSKRFMYKPLAKGNNGK